MVAERTKQDQPLDAKMLRALAHPLRMRLLEMLRIDGPATATGLGKRVSESSGTTSWHLRLLAEAGLVLEAPELGNKRERWWRARFEQGTSMRAKDFIHDPELAGPAETYLRSIVEWRYQAESQFIAELPQWAETPWADNTKFNDDQLTLTAEEAGRMSDEVIAVIDRYRRDKREGDDPVVVHWAAFPRTARPEAPES